MTPPKNDQNTDLQYPAWQGPVRDALVEMDMDQLEQRIMNAKTAVLNRLQAMPQATNLQDERRAIEDALNTLRLLEREVARTKQQMLG